MNLDKAQHAAEALKAILGGNYARWEVAGSVRRRKATVKDIKHVVIPRFADLPGDDDLFGSIQENVNLLWYGIDKLLRSNDLGRSVYTDKNIKRSFRWGDKYRGVDFMGFRHEIFTAIPSTWGAILAIRTGPAALSKHLVIRIRLKGYEMKDGQVFPIGRQHPTEVKEEVDFFHMAGIRPVPAPEDRK